MLPPIEQLVTVAQGWPQMTLVSTKVVSSPLCNFLMMQRSRSFLHNTEILGIFIHQVWALWALSVKIVYRTSPQSVRGCMWGNMIMVWHNNIVLWRYTAGCVLTDGFWGWDMAWDRANQHAYWTQQDFLIHVAHLLKLQNIQNSSQTNCWIDQFCWIWLLKRTRNGPF